MHCANSSKQDKSIVHAEHNTRRGMQLDLGTQFFA